MDNTKIRIDLLPNYYQNDDGTFNQDRAINLCGKIAGICYDKEGFSHLENEPIEKTNRRINMTLNNGHHSVYDHVTVNLNLQNIPKALAMVINNEHQYTTSEKSARYTPIVRNNDSIITLDEERLYNKWIELFKTKIKDQYGNVYNDNKILKLAQENARYLVTVFMPTQMIYSTSLRQINYITSWMLEYINGNLFSKEEYKIKLVEAMKQFIMELDRLNILVPGLMKNDKERKLSLFGSNLKSKKDYFGDVYTTTYKGSFAELAQAQRHRTLDYQMEITGNKEYFIPPIIESDQALVNEWLQDMNIVKNVNPQGELININEQGKYEDFILKCKERLCSAAQLEIMLQTRETLLKYKKYLDETNHPLKKDIVKYSHGSRCTFPDFICTSDCGFKEGKILIRKI